MNVKRSCLLLLYIVALAQTSFSQNSNYHISNLERKAIKTETLSQVQSLSDINSGFPSSWIGVYLSVDLSLKIDDETIQVSGVNEQFTNEQITLLKNAKVGSQIEFTIEYLPLEALGQNDKRRIEFSYSVIPETEAKYIGGPVKLNRYFKESIFDKIPENQIEGFTSAKLIFQISKEGIPQEIELKESSGNLSIDLLIRQSVQAMKAWKPAKEKDETVKQPFLLTIGNQVGC